MRPDLYQFDFWVGEWEVTAGGQTAGENRIEQSKDDGETWYLWFDGTYNPKN